MTCDNCKYAFDKTNACSFNYSFWAKELELIREQLEQTIYVKINPDFIKPLDDRIDDFYERAHDESVDESTCGCLGKYPLA